MIRRYGLEYTNFNLVFLPVGLRIDINIQEYGDHVFKADH